MTPNEAYRRDLRASEKLRDADFETAYAGLAADGF
jgi:hypothetical protein